MSDQALYRRTLRRALEMAGGQSALCRQLQLSETNLSAWLQGLQPIPDQMFLQLVDMVVASEIPASQPRPDDPAQSKSSRT